MAIDIAIFLDEKLDLSPTDKPKPEQFLTLLAFSGITWEIDFSRATEEEKLVWTRADMIARITGALWHGRAVFFRGTEYRLTDPNGTDFFEKIAEVEEAVVGSGLAGFIESDNEKGVTIGIAGHLH